MFDVESLRREQIVGSDGANDPSQGDASNGNSKEDDLQLTSSRTVTCRALYHAEHVSMIQVAERSSHGEYQSRRLFAAAIRSVSNEEGAIVRLVDPITASVVTERTLLPSEGNVTALTSATMIASRAYASATMLNLLIVSTADTRVSAYDLSTKLQKKKMDVSLKSAALVMATPANGEMVVCGDARGCLVVLLLSEVGGQIAQPGACVSVLPTRTVPQIHEGPFSALAMNNVEQVVFSAGLDHRIIQTCLKTFTVLRVLAGHRQAVLSLAYNERENVLISCGTEYKLYFWLLEMLDCKPQVVAAPSRNGTTCVGSLCGSSLAVSLDPKGLLGLWDARRATLLGTALCDPDNAISLESNSTHWSTFVLESSSNEQSFSAKKNSQKKLSPVAREMDDDVAATLIHIHGRRRLYTFRLRDSVPSHPYASHDANVARGAFYDPMARVLVSAAKRRATLWDVESASEAVGMRRLATSGGEITAICLLTNKPNLRKSVIAMGTNGGKVCFFNVSAFRSCGEYTMTAVDEVAELVALPYGHPEEDVMLLACRGAKGSVDLVEWNFATHKCRSLELPERNGTTVHCVSTISALVPVKQQLVSLVQPAVNPAPLQRQSLLVTGESSNVVTIWAVLPEPSIKALDVSMNASVRRSHSQRRRSSAIVPPSIPSDTSSNVAEATTEEDTICFNNLYSAASQPEGDATTALLCIDELSLIVSGDSKGSVHVWAFGYPIAWPLCHFSSRRYTPLLPHSCITAFAVAISMRPPILYIGDDTGSVSCFDLARCIPDHHTDGRPVAHPLSTWDANDHSLHPWAPPKNVSSRAVDAKPIHGWDAHPEAKVDQLLVLPDPLVLVSIASDHRIQMWYLGGTPLGCLISDANIAASKKKALEEQLEVQKGVDFSIPAAAPAKGTMMTTMSLRTTNHRSRISFVEHAPHTSFGEFLNQEGMSEQPQHDGNDEEGTVTATQHEPVWLTEVPFESSCHNSEGSPAASLASFSPLHRHPHHQQSTTDASAKDPHDPRLYRYNDLPPPYGQTVAKRKQTMYLLKGLMELENSTLRVITQPPSASATADSDEEEESAQSSKDLLRRLSTMAADDDKEPRGEGALHNAAKGQSNPSLSALASRTSRQPSKYPVTMQPLHGTAPTATEEPEEEKVVEGPARRDGSPRRLDVPAYMSKRRLQEVDTRPDRTSYTPALDVDQVTYGSATNFAAFMRTSLGRAHRLEKMAHTVMESAGATTSKAEQPTSPVRRSVLPALRVRMQPEHVSPLAPVSRSLPADAFPSSKRHRLSPAPDDIVSSPMTEHSIPLPAQVGTSNNNNNNATFYLIRPLAVHDVSVQKTQHNNSSSQRTSSKPNISYTRAEYTTTSTNNMFSRKPAALQATAGSSSIFSQPKSHRPEGGGGGGAPRLEVGFYPNGSSPIRLTLSDLL